jgi:hypothetical protein
MGEREPRDDRPDALALRPDAPARLADVVAGTGEDA